jgi:hypothetical protein
VRVSLFGLTVTPALFLRNHAGAACFGIVPSRVPVGVLHWNDQRCLALDVGVPRLSASTRLVHVSTCAQQLGLPRGDPACTNCHLFRKDIQS